MSTTTIRIPEKLKTRVARAAKQAGTTAHGFMLEAIECSDAGLQAAMASIRTDSGPTGKRNDFEAAVAHLIPYDPVAKKRAAVKQVRISDVATDADVGATTVKSSIGKTGVHLRFHKQDEYKLNPNPYPTWV